MRLLVSFITLLLVSPVAQGQADDLAAERARLANQRIEAEARAREEQEREARLAAERARAAANQQTVAAADAERGVAAADPSRQPAPVVSTQTPTDVNRLLEQIRTLGELRDSGYVTDAEFERIKRRILDGAL